MKDVDITVHIIFLQSFPALIPKNLLKRITEAQHRSGALRKHKFVVLSSQSFLTFAVERSWRYLSTTPARSSGTTISIQNFTHIKARNSVSETLGRGASFALTRVNPTTLYISRVPALATTPSHASFLLFCSPPRSSLHYTPTCLTSRCLLRVLHLGQLLNRTKLGHTHTLKIEMIL